MSDFLPFNPDNLAAGPGRFLYALHSVAAPTQVSDVIDPKAPYTPKTGWNDGGGVVDPYTIARNLSVQGFGYQQSTGNAVERPNDIERSILVPFGELTAATLEIVEQSTKATTAAGSAGSHQGAGVKVPFGSIPDLGAYRVALIWKFQESQGLVTEPTTLLTRGRLVMWTGYKASLTGDNVSEAVDENAPWQAPVTFKLYPDTAVSTTESAEYGFWWTENAGQTLP
jgi:hypothetical protein